MKAEEHLFALLLGGNFLLSCGYYLFCIFYCIPRRKDAEKAENAGTYLLRTILMILCPVLGPLYLGCSFLLAKLFRQKEMDFSSKNIQKKQMWSYAMVDREREQNLASIEETLSVGDQKNLRTLMLNVLRGDLDESLGAIAMALDSKDSETMHYAASVLRDELNDFRVRVQKIQEEILQEPEEETALEGMLFDYISRILQQRVLSNLEQKKYVQILEETAERLYHKNAADLTAAQYAVLCDTMCDCGMMENAEKWTARLEKQYPKERMAYTSRLKLAFQKNDREQFFATLTELKRSGVEIDPETLERIQVFE